MHIPGYVQTRHPREPDGYGRTDARDIERKGSQREKDARTVRAQGTSASIGTPKEGRYDAYGYRTDRDEGGP